MWDREFSTEDGRNWYEPRPEECEEHMSVVQPVILTHICMTCGQDISGPMAKVHYMRTRTYIMQGMATQWSEWSAWQVTGYEHMHDLRARYGTPDGASTL